MDRFEQISSECARRAWALAYSLVRNAADADDVVQKAYLVAWQRRDVIPADPWPWFAMVVTNSARNLRKGAARRRVREERLQHMPPDPGPAPQGSLEQDELRDLLLTALASLPQEEREAVALCHIAGLTQVQASETSGVNLNTLKSRVKRGLDRMRGRLQAQAQKLESYLATMAVPIPVGGWDAAIARWESGARTGAIQTGSPAALALKLVAGLTVPGAALVAAWLLLDLGAEPSPQLPRAAASAAEPVPIVARGGMDQPNPSTEDARLVASRVKLPIAVPADLPPLVPAERTAVPLGDEPAGRQVLSPLPGSETSTVRVRTSFYESGALYMQWIEEVTPAGAILQGSHIRLHLSGSLWQEGQYLNNKREGIWTARHENGAMESQGAFVQGLSEGMWTWWYPDSVVKAKGEYRRELREGEWRYWHPTGHLKSIMQFKDDMAEGPSTHFDEQGRKVRTSTWHKGKKHGPEVEFDLDGNPSPARQFVDGVPQ